MIGKTHTKAFVKPLSTYPTNKDPSTHLLLVYFYPRRACVSPVSRSRSCQIEHHHLQPIHAVPLSALYPVVIRAMIRHSNKIPRGLQSLIPDAQIDFSRGYWWSVQPWSWSGEAQKY